MLIMYPSKCYEKYLTPTYEYENLRAHLPSCSDEIHADTQYTPDLTPANAKSQLFPQQENQFSTASTEPISRVAGH